MNIINLMPESPFRPVDWRWQLARTLREQGKATGRLRSDRWLNRAIQMQKLREARCHAMPPDLEPLVDAMLIHESPSMCLPGVLQARLLAGQSHEGTARRCGLSPEVLEAYEQVFFNVADRLQCSSWVSRAIDPDGTFRTGMPSRELVIKHFAYRVPHIVERLIPYLDESISDAQCRPQSTVAEARLDRLIRLAIAIAALPASGRAARFVPRVKALVEQLDRADANRSAAAVSRPMNVALELSHDLLGHVRQADAELIAHYPGSELNPLILPFLELIENDETAFEETLRYLAAVG